jgi:nascent polypeptide-associated complex subunit alpha
MQKLGMKQVTGIVRVTIKKAKNILFVISKPDVFKSTAAETYVIFGEAKIEDMNSQAQAAAAKQFNPEAAAKPAAAAAAPAAAAAEDDNEVVDETGLDPDEINTIMSQASCSRAKAAKALRKHKNIVDAILELTP